MNIVPIEKYSKSLQNNTEIGFRLQNNTNENLDAFQSWESSKKNSPVSKVGETVETRGVLTIGYQPT